VLFSDNAARLAGMAGALLGWGPDEFWRATPAELMAVVRAMVGGNDVGLATDKLAELMARFPDRHPGEDRVHEMPSMTGFMDAGSSPA
jgi:uncharacterized phage protein (TIGR02216 family)